MWSSQNTLWYFCSTLAQSAAAFAALVAVFTVFRLQALSAATEDAYRNAWDWFQRQGALRVMDVSFSKGRIMRELKGRATEPSEAQEWVSKIQQLESYPKSLEVISKPIVRA